MTYRPYNQLQTSGVSDERSNNTGTIFTKGTPVRINTSGELDFVNVSVESEILNIAGIASQNIPTGLSGMFINNGKIEGIITSAAFGDVIYISKTGGLTNIKPSIGVGSFVAGDFSVMVGVIAKNEANPLVKDLILNIDIQGQL